jgi:hypothetical protein
MSQAHWNKFNNVSWKYKEIIQFDKEWALIECIRLEGESKEVSIFHLSCLPNPAEFRQGYKHVHTTEQMIGCVADDGMCDKCEIGPAPMNYRLRARFTYPETYDEPCKDEDSIEEDE